MIEPTKASNSAVSSELMTLSFLLYRVSGTNKRNLQESVTRKADGCLRLILVHRHLFEQNHLCFVAGYILT